MLLYLMRRPRRSHGDRTQRRQRRGLIRFIGNSGGCLRGDPDLPPGRAAQQHPFRGRIDPDDIDGANRAGFIDVNRGDARGLQEMVGKKFAPGRHGRSKADRRADG